MKLVELRSLLAENRVPLRWYSINEGLKSDAHILGHGYPKWAYFYIDEFGSKYDFREFESEEEAYDFLWERIVNQLRVQRRIGNQE